MSDFEKYIAFGSLICLGCILIVLTSVSFIKNGLSLSILVALVGAALIIISFKVKKEYEDKENAEKMFQEEFGVKT